VKSTMKMDDGTLSVVALGCYVFAATVWVVATYTLWALSQTVYGNLGQGLYLTASLF
jgi:hypothetical protein